MSSTAVYTNNFPATATRQAVCLSTIYLDSRRDFWAVIYTEKTSRRCRCVKALAARGWTRRFAIGHHLYRQDAHTHSAVDVARPTAATPRLQLLHCSRVAPAGRIPVIRRLPHSFLYIIPTDPDALVTAAADEVISMSTTLSVSVLSKHQWRHYIRNDWTQAVFHGAVNRTDILRRRYAEAWCPKEKKTKKREQ